MSKVLALISKDEIAQYEIGEKNDTGRRLSRIISLCLSWARVKFQSTHAADTADVSRHIHGPQVFRPTYRLWHIQSTRAYMITVRLPI
jgi:hypothetical protein